MKPFEGNREELGRLIERKQKSLVPLNIAVMIICIVAAVSLLFAPLVSIDMGAMSEAMASMQGEDESDGQADAQSEAMQEADAPKAPQAGAKESAEKENTEETPSGEG